MRHKTTVTEYYKPTQRVLTIIQYLLDMKHPKSVPQILAVLERKKVSGISARTIERDIRFLRKFGFIIINKPSKGYILIQEN